MGRALGQSLGHAPNAGHAYGKRNTTHRLMAFSIDTRGRDLQSIAEEAGERFYPGADHKFNCDAFRDAMVEISSRYGVRLEPAWRTEQVILSGPVGEILF